MLNSHPLLKDESRGCFQGKLVYIYIFPLYFLMIQQMTLQIDAQDALCEA